MFLFRLLNRRRLAVLDELLMPCPRLRAHLFGWNKSRVTEHAFEPLVLRLLGLDQRPRFLARFGVAENVVAYSAPSENLLRVSDYRHGAGRPFQDDPPFLFRAAHPLSPVRSVCIGT